MVQISSNNNRVTHPKVVSSLKHPFPQDSGDEYSASIKNENWISKLVFALMMMVYIIVCLISFPFFAAFDWLIEIVHRNS